MENELENKFIVKLNKLISIYNNELKEVDPEEEPVENVNKREDYAFKSLIERLVNNYSYAEGIPFDELNFFDELIEEGDYTVFATHIGYDYNYAIYKITKEVAVLDTDYMLEYYAANNEANFIESMCLLVDYHIKFFNSPATPKERKVVCDECIKTAGGDKYKNLYELILAVE